MAWKSGQSYSADLRSRVLAAVDGGSPARAMAQLFQLSVSYVYKAVFNAYQYGYGAALSMVIFGILLTFSLVFLGRTRATEAAYCTEFIKRLPQGFKTIVGERGLKLSGGQRQRIAIARAFLSDAPIILLDEATSALDTESEQLIQEALTRLVQGRTVIAVAHRLSTLDSFDRIIVLEWGRIVEDGPSAELLQRNGPYSRMYRRQLASREWV